MNKIKNFILKNKEICILVLLVILIGGGFLVNKLLSSDKKESPTKEKVEKVPEKVTEPVKKLKIIDEESTTRPVCVTIDNVSAAWPHAGIGDAYLVYEIIVEGGYTRLFACFRDVSTKMIGPVRSLRHYYIDYALENEAVIAHFGQSPQAQSDLSALNINNLNGIINPGNMFWRDSSITYAPHNAFTSMENIKTQMEKQGYNREVSNIPLNYSVEEISVEKQDNVLQANNIIIPYSYAHKTSYIYDTENKVYKRSMNDKPHMDRETNIQYTVKNIILIKVSNYTLDDSENKGRQGLNNIGSGNGYYITNGYAAPITWEKSSRKGKTIYKYSNGEEIKLNDGNTYIQIEPQSQNPTITG